MAIGLFQQTRVVLRRIVFGTHTSSGRIFDVCLIVAIVASVIAVMLASVPSIRAHWTKELRAIEWVFTGLFTAEYLMRIWIARCRRDYIFSFYGAVDLLAILPTYISVLLPGAEYLTVIRALRVLRVFRILKLLAFMQGAQVLRQALWASRHKVAVFFTSVVTVVTLIGSLMYLIEGEKNGFTSIPISVYWAVVTLTTVGYGDISPATPLGQILATGVMLLGYAIIAVPTGIVTAEMVGEHRYRQARTLVERGCERCGTSEHLQDARYCRICGEKFDTEG